MPRWHVSPYLKCARSAREGGTRASAKRCRLRDLPGLMHPGLRRTGGNAFNQCCAKKEPTGLDVGDAICEGSNDLDDLRCERGEEASRVAVLVASMKRVLADGQA